MLMPSGRSMSLSLSAVAPEPGVTVRSVPVRVAAYSRLPEM